MAQIADSLGAALGADVEVSPKGGKGYRVQLAFDSVDEALDLARRLSVRAAA